jgi:hypothetical protein
MNDLVGIQTIFSAKILEIRSVILCYSGISSHPDKLSAVLKNPVYRIGRKAI